MSIRNKLTLSFLLVVLIPLLSLLAVQNELLSNAIYDSYEEKARSDASRIAEYTIKKMRESAKNYVHFLARDSSFVQAAYYATAVGKTTDLDEIVAEAKERLALSSIEVIDLKSNQPVGSGHPLHPEDYILIQDAVNGKTPVTIDYNGEIGQFEIHAASLIQRNLKNIGVLLGGYTLDSGLLSTLVTGADVFLYNADAQRSAFTVDLPINRDWVKSSYQTTISTCSDDTSSGLCEDEKFTTKQEYINGTHYLLVGIPIRDAQNQPFGFLVIAQAARELAAKLNHTLHTTVLLTIGSLIFAAIFAFLIARSLSKPIVTLCKAVTSFGSGNFDTVVGYASRDELGELSAVFNRMRIQLKDTISQKETVLEELQRLNVTLEDKIAERTKDLQTSEARVRAILDNINEGIAVINPTGTIQSVNPSMADMFGLSKRRIDNIKFDTLLDDQEKVFASAVENGASLSIDQLISEHATHPVECNARRKDGGTFPIEFFFSEMSLADKTMYICVVRDITTRRETEAQLEDVQKQLVDAAHQSGMAEIATGILHNIGNILNSVNLSTEELDRILSNFKLPPFSKAVDMLESNRDDLANFLTKDEKGKKLCDYLIMLQKSFAQDHDKSKQEVACLKEKVQMIKDVISTQQEYAKGTSYSEEIDIGALIEDAIKVEQSSLNKTSIGLTKNLEVLPKCRVHKTKLLQVMTNLIKNAKEATLEVDRAGVERNIVIESGLMDTSHAFIKVIDNGCGISKSHIDKVFQHGFTTKQNGHGFGLHASVIAMNEMSGNIAVESDGPNQGTTFTVTVPLADKKCAA